MRNVWFKIILMFVLAGTGYVQAQTVIYSENFNSYANCVNQNSPVWTTVATNSDDGNAPPGCQLNQNYWGVLNGEFVCNDLEGPGENCQNFFTTQDFDIRCYSNVTISFYARHQGTMECNGSGYDEIRGFYALNGGPWVQFAYVCGSVGLPNTFSVSGLSGNTVAFRISIGNKANDEYYYLDNILITGHPLQFANAGPDQSVCVGNTVQLNATGGGTYAWNASPDLSCTSCAGPVASPVANNQYIVTITDGNGCIDKDTVNVSLNPIPVVNLGNDTLLCGSTNLVLNAGNPGATYHWQNNSTAQTFVASGAGTYYVDVTLAGCTGSDTLHIQQGTAPVANLGNDTVVCGSSVNIPLNVTQSGATYHWQDNSTNATYTVTQPGTFYVSVTNVCGSTSDTLHVQQNSVPVVNLGNDTLVCGSSVNIPLNATQPGATYHWQDNSTNATYTVTQPGTFYVSVTNVCGSTSDTLHVQQNSVPVVNLGNDTLVCGSSVNIPLNVTQPGATYHWQDNSTNATYTVTQPGTFYVSVTNVCGSTSDTLHVQQNSVPVVNLGNDTLVCGSSVNIPLNVTQPGAAYHWQDNSTNATYTITQPGTFYVSVTNACGSISDTLHVQQNAVPVVNLGNDTLVCGGSVNIPLNVTQPGAATYHWQNNSTNATYTVTQPGIFYVSVTNACGSASDTLHVLQGTPPVVNLGNDTLVCGGSVNIPLNVTQPGAATYHWQNNSTNATYTVTQPGTFYVSVTNACGSISDTLHVQQNMVPVVNLGNDTLICGNNVNIPLNATQPGATYHWQDNSTNATYTVTQPGTFYVSVTNVCGSTSDTLHVVQSGIPVIDLGPVRILCYNETVVLDATVPVSATYHWQDNASAPAYQVQHPGVYYVTVSTACGNVSDTITFAAPYPLNETLHVLEGSCGDDSVLVDLAAVHPGADFYWSTGDTTSFVTITQSGEYEVTISYCNATLVDTFEVIIKSSDPDQINVPDVFSPNGDFINDEFLLNGTFEHTVSFQAHIFNRWGQLVFKSDDTGFVWDGMSDGQPVPEGTYFLVLDMKKECEQQQNVQLSSTITIFR